MKVTGFNPPTDDLEKTYVSAYKAAGATTLAVKNNDRFVNTHPILIGVMGDERSELSILSSVNSNKIEIGVSATKFSHNSDDPVYALDYNQMRFYRRTGIDGAPILMTTTDLDVDNEDEITVWDDATSLPTHYYQTSWYNSVTDDESDLSDLVPATGYAVETAGNIIDQVVRRVRDTNFNVLTIDEYLDIMNEVGSDLITQAHKPYRFLKRTELLDTIHDQAYVSLPTTLWKFDKISVALTSGNYQRFDPLMPLSEEQFRSRYDNNQTSPQDNIRDVAIDEDERRLLVYPTPKTSQTGVIKLKFYKGFSAITDVGSVIETPNNLIYRYKLMAEFYSAKSETDNQWLALAKKYEDKYGNEIIKMQRVNRLDTGTPRSMRPPRTYRRRRYHL